jgi:periplasmic protein TonB
MRAVAETTPGRYQSGRCQPERYASGRPSPERPLEAIRWVICFIIAATLHGIIAYYLLERLTETAEDSGVDTPVVMLDLPESLVPSIAPPQDLPPGPMERQETEPTPPPKEETKPPEPEAEVALPMPEPPKPDKPPAEKIEAAAPQATRTPPPSVVRWQSLLGVHIERFMRYPAAARAHGDVGIAMVAFTIDGEGHLLRSSIVQSSGSAALDQETFAILARAQPMPRPAPGQLTDGELTVVVPMRFKLR